MAYASVGYKTEFLAKTSFIGRESSEKSFYRWLSIFDTFPEGMAIVKDDGTILYSNDSLAKLFECDALPKTSLATFSKSGVKSEHGVQAKKMLENVEIRKHVYQDDDSGEIKAILVDQERKNHSVWDFVAKNFDGATFELIKTPMYQYQVAEEQKQLISNEAPIENYGLHANRVDGD